MSENRDALGANHRNMGNSMRTCAAFMRSEFYNTTIYRISFWLRFVYTFLMMYSMGFVWQALYESGAGQRDWSLTQITAYGIMGVALESILHPYNGPQTYMMEQVRKGTIEMDIMKPLDFQFHMYAKNMGALLVRLLFMVIPSLWAAYFLFGFPLPSLEILPAFLLSLFLSIQVSFLLNFLLVRSYY